jgi:hypothetical protein
MLNTLNNSIFSNEDYYLYIPLTGTVLSPTLRTIPSTNLGNINLEFLCII